MDNVSESKQKEYNPAKGNPLGYRYTVVLHKLRKDNKGRQKVFVYISHHQTQKYANKAYEGKGKVTYRKLIFIPQCEIMKEENFQ